MLIVLCVSRGSPFSLHYIGLVHLTAHVQNGSRKTAEKRKQTAREVARVEEGSTGEEKGKHKMKRSYSSRVEKRRKKEETRKLMSKLPKVTIFFHCACGSGQQQREAAATHNR